MDPSFNHCDHLQTCHGPLENSLCTSYRTISDLSKTSHRPLLHHLADHHGPLAYHLCISYGTIIELSYTSHIPISYLSQTSHGPLMEPLWTSCRPLEPFYGPLVEQCIPLVDLILTSLISCRTITDFLWNQHGPLWTSKYSWTSFETLM